MPQTLIESLRNSLIAAQCSPDPALRQLALRRYDLAWRAIAHAGGEAQEELHARLFGMLPSDWPLWVERYRPAQGRSALSRARAG